MIHIFSYKDKNYIYDSGSGSLHECDKDTADYIKYKYENGPEVKFDSEKTALIERDVEELEKAGLFLRKEVDAYPIK